MALLLSSGPLHGVPLSPLPRAFASTLWYDQCVIKFYFQSYDGIKFIKNWPLYDIDIIKSQGIKVYEKFVKANIQVGILRGHLTL